MPAQIALGGQANPSLLLYQILNPDAQSCTITLMDPQHQQRPPRPEDYTQQSGNPEAYVAPTTPLPQAPQPAVPYSPDLNSPAPGQSYAQVGAERQAIYAQPIPPSDPLPASDHPNAFSWTASEFIAHHKEPSWYMILAGGAFIVSLLVYAVTGDAVSSIVIIIGAVLFGVSASRQPREMSYAVDGHGLSIGSRIFPYKDFRSFSVVDEGAFSSVVLMPLKRFAPPVSLYYHPQDAATIVKILADHLPLQEHKHDMTDSLMRRIRF